MNLVALLRERADTHPDRPALIDRAKGKDRVMSYRELLHRVEQGAAQLQGLGLKRGSTLLLFQPVSIELYEILLSAFHAGLRVMLADPSAGKGFLTLCCERLPPDAFFGPWKAQLLRRLVPALKKIPLSIRSGGWFPGTVKWSADFPAAPLTDLPDEEPALITFTSGSTGVPKAAVRTHGFLLAQHKALSRALDFEDGEVDLVTLPVFVLANLASGLTSVLADIGRRPPGNTNVDVVSGQCQRHGVTRCAASPDFFSTLLEKRQDSLKGMRKVFTGGGPVSPFLLQDLKAVLPDSTVTAVFGSTEAEPMTHLDAAEYDIKKTLKTASGHGLLAGHPVDEIELRILREQWGQPLKQLDREAFEAMTVPPGQAGEIVVSGDHVLPGYLGGLGDEETKIHVEGRIWHRTGDAAWIDEEGCLWLLGRCSAKLPHCTVEGKDLPEGALDFPFAIEYALRLRFPKLPMAAVGWKGRRVLVVEGPRREKGDTLAREIMDFGLEDIIEVEKIPLDRRHNAKVDYTALQALLGKMA